MTRIMQKLRIITTGFIGLLPAGGVTWDYLQYPLGLAEMGHEVYYLEDTQLYPIYQAPGKAWDDASDSIAHLQKVMDHFGFRERWCYRDEASGQHFGLSEKELKDICSSADIFINVSCSTVMREAYAQIPVRVLIDSDPMFTQIQLETGLSFTGKKSSMRDLVDKHTHHFTFGENLGSSECKIPTAGINWMPTRQPICLDYWPVLPLPKENLPTFTTLMNWSAGKTLQFGGQSWGQKDEEFEKIIRLPQKLNKAAFAIVVNQTGGATFPKEELEAKGWTIQDPNKVAGDWTDYQQFIQQSFAEFSVAKNTYVKSNSGWFSCRSACYLASGRPVITQDTAWSKYIPTGKGLFSFCNLEEAVEAVQQIMNRPQEHSQAAREIAIAFFDSEKVLGAMLNQL